MRIRHPLDLLLRVTSYVAGFLGIIQLFELSEKGRATQWVEALEPRIRRKYMQRKLFPPIIIAILYVEEVSAAFTAMFRKQIFLIERPRKRERIQQLAAANARGATSRFGAYRLLRRKGNPFEKAPWIKCSARSKTAIQELLRLMNLDPDREFVLLGVRDASYYEYLKSKGDRIRPGIETEADTYIRNPDLHSYLDAARALVSNGIQVIRFGISDTPLSGDLCSCITDYSTRFRTPERDLLLAKHCRATISGNSGIWCFASLHNKPVLFADSTTPLGSGVSTRDRMVPQLLYDLSTNRLLSFREMFVSGDTYSFESACHRDGITLRKNSPEEITEAVLELLDLDGEIQQQASDDYQLLRRFQELRESIPSYSELWQYCQGRIGLRFLRRHRELLD